MSKNEQSSAKLASLAGEIMNGREATPEEIRSLAASVLTQAPDKNSEKMEVVPIVQNFDYNNSLGRCLITKETKELLATGNYLLSVAYREGVGGANNSLDSLSIIPVAHSPKKPKANPDSYEKGA